VTGSSSSAGSGTLIIDLQELTPVLTMEINSGSNISAPTNRQGKPLTFSFSSALDMPTACAGQQGANINPPPEVSTGVQLSLPRILHLDQLTESRVQTTG
jgi:hypothetical protein